MVLDSQETAEVLYVFGELDASGAAEFEAEIMTSAIAGKNLVIELSECRYIDSAIISTLIRARSVLGEALAIVVAPDSGLDRLFRASELHERLGIVASVERASS